MRRKLVPSRLAAREAIESGVVTVDGSPVSKASSLVAPGAAVHITRPTRRFASRGGDKLAAALLAFDIEVAGARCLDAGASTGGFTDCLLQHGAASVVAVDVGYGQLDWSLRSDGRVTVHERTNIKAVDAESVGAPFDVIVADLSFISLVKVSSHLAALGGPATDYVLLVKPQFEAGKDQVGRGGVVREPEVHRECIEAVAAAMASHGVAAAGVIASPLLGPAGNREFLLWARPGAEGLAESEVAQAVAT